MGLHHEAILRLYPNAALIDDGIGVFDDAGNPILIDQAKVDQMAVVVDAEKELEEVRIQRSIAYKREADPLFFQAQRGEATMDDWTAKVDEIKARFPFPEGGDQ